MNSSPTGPLMSFAESLMSSPMYCWGAQSAAPNLQLSQGLAVPSSRCVACPGKAPLPPLRLSTARRSSGSQGPTESAAPPLGAMHPLPLSKGSRSRICPSAALQHLAASPHHHPGDWHSSPRLQFLSGPRPQRSTALLLGGPGVRESSPPTILYASRLRCAIPLGMAKRWGSFLQIIERPLGSR
ncbi:hypothetical protein NDU88_001765 [Pleurodeles waltl]|uniref:Uncharacterized protein n=1 Tax=Pleurodeles waltl TaxID=8319 RepID=A0AAV7Q7T1_PLEWA|nr:hypothetical protein NDU88_001765 [Pleurodeles waltl]